MFSRKKLLPITIVIGAILIIAVGIHSGTLLQGSLASNIPQPIPNRTNIDINANTLPHIETIDGLGELYKNHYLDQTGLTNNSGAVTLTREAGVFMAFQVLNPMVGKITPFYDGDYINKNYFTCFDDIGSSYAKIFICWTKHNKFLANLSNSFSPTVPLKRHEAIILLGNVLKEKWYADLKNIDSLNLVLQYPDKNTFSAYPDLEKYLKLFSTKNILPFQPNANFSPNSTISVGDFTEMLFRAKLVDIYEVQAYDTALRNRYLSDKKLCKTPSLVQNNEAPLTEKINFIALKSNTVANPNWKTDADNFIKNVNLIYQPTGVQLSIANYLIMPDDGPQGALFYEYMQNHPEYFSDLISDQKSQVKGLSIFACYGTQDEFNQNCPFSRGFGGYKTNEGDVFVNGKHYDYVSYGHSTQNANVLAHEIGHHFATSNSPTEWYSLHGIDGVYPPEMNQFVVDYLLCLDNPIYKQDPMCGPTGNIFSPQSIKVIKLNSRHKYNQYSIVDNPQFTNDYYQQIKELRTEKIHLKVLSNNIPLANQTVEVLFPNISAGNIPTNEYVNPYFQGKTDSSGIIYLDAPYGSQNFHSFLIKVKNGAQTQKKFITYPEMEADNLLKNACVSDLTIAF